MTRHNTPPRDADIMPPVRPVEVRTCPVCHGDGYVEINVNDCSGVSDVRDCNTCHGRGRVATHGGEA